MADVMALIIGYLLGTSGNEAYNSPTVALRKKRSPRKINANMACSRETLSPCPFSPASPFCVMIFTTEIGSIPKPGSALPLAAS